MNSQTRFRDESFPSDSREKKCVREREREREGERASRARLVATPRNLGDDDKMKRTLLYQIRKSARGRARALDTRGERSRKRN